MAIEINEAMEVVIDGEHAGKPVDCLVNHKSRASDIQRTMTDWMTDREAQKEAALSDKAKALDEAAASAKQIETLKAAQEKAAADLAALVSEHASEVKGLNISHEEYVDAIRSQHKGELKALAAAHQEAVVKLTADKDQQIADRDAKIKELQDANDALGGTELGLELKKQNELAAIAEQEAKLAKRKAELEATS